MKSFGKLKVTLQNGADFLFEEFETEEGMSCAHLVQEDIYGYGDTFEKAVEDALWQAHKQWSSNV